MKKYKWILILSNLLLLLVFFNFSVVKKEQTLKEGKLILLDLAPVDPRSLMQGDYMQLAYAITNGRSSTDIPKRGYCVVELDKNGVVNRYRFQKVKSKLLEGQYLIKYFSGKWSLNIGAESYFFQEGTAEKYDKAKYGGIRVDEEGNSVLVGLYDENRKQL